MVWFDHLVKGVFHTFCMSLRPAERCKYLVWPLQIHQINIDFFQIFFNFAHYRGASCCCTYGSVCPKHAYVFRVPQTHLDLCFGFTALLLPEPLCGGLVSELHNLSSLMSSITSSSFWRRSRRVIQKNHKKRWCGRVWWCTAVSLAPTCLLWQTVSSTLYTHSQGRYFPFLDSYAGPCAVCFLSRFKVFYQPSLHAIAQESNHMTQPQRTHPIRAISANRTRARPVVDASQSRVIIFKKLVEWSSYLQNN